MKKFLLMASALLILGGCTIDNIEFQNKKENPTGEELRITAAHASANQDEPLKAVSSDENGPSRVSYNDPFDPLSHPNPADHPAIEVTWAQNDKILVHDFTQQGTSAEFNLQSGQGTKFGEFTGQNPQQTEGNQLKAIYPVKPEYDREWDYIEMSVIGQAQNGNKNMDHISQYDYMIGDVVLTDNSTGVKSAEVSLKRQIALMKFVLTLPADIGTPEQIVMSTANQSIVTIQEIGRGATKASLLALGLSNITVTEGQPIVAYLAALPFSLTNEDLAIKVVGSKKHYQYTAANVTTSYLAGEQYVAVLSATDFTDVTPTGPVAINVPAGDINGKYAQIGGLKVTREGFEEDGIKKTKAEMAVNGSSEMTEQEPILLAGGDIVELLVNNNDGGSQAAGFGGFWIDWNRDGVLDNTTEAIILPGRASGTIAAGAENVLMYPAETEPFVIPADKPDGLYYGRVMRDYQDIVNAHTATESVTYIDFAIQYMKIYEAPKGDPIADFINPSDAAVNILSDDVTRTFTVKLNKRVETTPVEITLEATTDNPGHNGTLGSTTITIPVGERQGTGTITFAKTDFTEPGTHDADITITITSIVGGVIGTSRPSIVYNVKVVDTSNAINYAFRDYYQSGPELTEITENNYYRLEFRATNGTIPEGTVVNLTYTGTFGDGIYWESGQSSGFPATLTISETNKSFSFSTDYWNGNVGTLVITSDISMTPTEGLKLNVPGN